MLTEYPMKSLRVSYEQQRWKRLQYTYEADHLSGFFRHFLVELSTRPCIWTCLLNQPWSLGINLLTVKGAISDNLCDICIALPAGNRRHLITHLVAPIWNFHFSCCRKVNCSEIQGTGDSQQVGHKPPENVGRWPDSAEYLDYEY